MYMYIKMNAHMNTCSHANMPTNKLHENTHSHTHNTHTHKCIYTCTHAHTCIHAHKQTHRHTYAHIGTGFCPGAIRHIRVHTCISYMYVCIHTYMYKHSHTYTFIHSTNIHKHVRFCADASRQISLQWMACNGYLNRRQFSFKHFLHVAVSESLDFRVPVIVAAYNHHSVVAAVPVTDELCLKHAGLNACGRCWCDLTFLDALIHVSTTQ
jgi:hypothetical protein